MVKILNKSVSHKISENNKNHFKRILNDALEF
jgi:hypothetical protein